MVRKSAWLLNLDAEDELARPAGYAPSRAMLARFQGLAERTGTLLQPGDVVLAEGQPAPLDAGNGNGNGNGHGNGRYLGRAWCPTPRARKALQRAGAVLLPAPPLEILQAVNHRRFSADLGQTLPGACHALSLEEVTAAVHAPSPGGVWLLKRPFGFAGRGRIKLSLDRAGDWQHALPWIEASLRSGGLQVEPLVQRQGDFAWHGHVSQAGAIVLGEPTRQECDDSGAWSGSARTVPRDLATSEEEALFEQVSLAATALKRAGYWGPFGVDGFRWRESNGELHFNARSEINARYSMGWATGMGGRRPDLDEA